MIVGEREKIIAIKCRKCTIRCMDLINPIVLSNGPPVRALSLIYVLHKINFI